MSGIAVAVGTMKAAQISKPGAGFQIVEREIPEPGAGQVRIKVNACGVCHSDALVVEGSWPGLPYPRVPGHEVAGVVDAVGAGVSEWKKGQRVGIGWHGGHDFICPECRRGDFMNCRKSASHGFQLRRRLSGIHAGPARSPCGHTGERQRRRCCAPHVRRYYDLQRPETQWRTAR